MYPWAYSQNTSSKVGCFYALLHLYIDALKAELRPRSCRSRTFHEPNLITSAEREVKDSRRSGMYQSWHFWNNIGHPKSVGFRFYSAIWRSESWISSRCLEITLSSLIYSLTYSRKKELVFWLSRGLNRLTCVTRQIRGDSKLRD